LDRIRIAFTTKDTKNMKECTKVQHPREAQKNKIKPQKRKGAKALRA